MALIVECTICGEELTEPGAVLIGPPDDKSQCIKEHICVGCYPVLQHTISCGPI